MCCWVVIYTQRLIYLMKYVEQCKTLVELSVYVCNRTRLRTSKDIFLQSAPAPGSSSARPRRPSPRQRFGHRPGATRPQRAASSSSARLRRTLPPAAVSAASSPRPPAGSPPLCSHGRVIRRRRRSGSPLRSGRRRFAADSSPTGGGPETGIVVDAGSSGSGPAAGRVGGVQFRGTVAPSPTGRRPPRGRNPRPRRVPVVECARRRALVGLVLVRRSSRLRPEQVPADRGHVAEDPHAEHHHDAGGELAAHAELVAQVDDDAPRPARSR